MEQKIQVVQKEINFSSFTYTTNKIELHPQEYLELTCLFLITFAACYDMQWCDAALLHQIDVVQKRFAPGLRTLIK